MCRLEGIREKLKLCRRSSGFPGGHGVGREGQCCERQSTQGAGVLAVELECRVHSGERGVSGKRRRGGWGSPGPVTAADLGGYPVRSRAT